MDLSEDQLSEDVNNRTLPQFSEIRLPLNASLRNGNVQLPNDENVQFQSSAMKSSRNLTLKQIPDITSLLDSCDLSLIARIYEEPIMKQMINPIFSSNNTLNTQSNIMPNNISDIIGSMYSSSILQENAVKQELDVQPRKEINLNKDSQIQLNQQQTMLTEYFQKIQATSLQQLIKLQTEQVKKQGKIQQAMQEQKTQEQTQNSILNIPSVRSLHQSNSNFINSDQMIVAINPNDLQNEQGENENNLQPVPKVERLVKTSLSKIDKKLKFRAKISGIKVSVGYDGTTLYSCSECNSRYSDKLNIERHIQAHLRERKYECKECGAMLKRKEHLDQHMRGHSNERPYKCIICLKAFKRNEHLTRHGVIHTGNKDFTCPECSKAFSRKDHLNKHIQTHLGIRKNKTKDGSYYINQKDTMTLFDNRINPTMMLKQETKDIKDPCLLKHESNFLQHLQKNPTLLHTFSSLKEQISRSVNVPQQAQSDNTNGNARYLTPS
ncbi:zinc finger protein 37 [Camponotus floridanus]|nr:zinc finger protein 37 [Camponotus floridanus]